MTSTEIRKLLKVQPFHPFTLHLADGRSFHVAHPELMLAPPEMRITWVAHDRTVDLVDLLLVTSVEVKPPSSFAA